MTKEEKEVLENKYITLSECSKKLKDKGISISTQTLRTRIKEEKLKAYMFTNEFLVKPSDLEAYIENVAQFKPKKEEKTSKPKKRDVKSSLKRKAKRVVKSIKKSAKKGR